MKIAVEIINWIVLTYKNNYNMTIDLHIYNNLMAYYLDLKIIK